MEEKNNSSFLQSNNPLNEQPVNNETAQLNNESKIKEILAEQQKLQQLYNEVVVYIQQHPTMPTEEMIKYQTQLKQLSEYYQTNQEKLKTLGYSSVQVNRNVVIKKWARRNLSIKTIFLGCAVIILLFVLGLGVLSYYLASNPGSLGGFTALGIAPGTAKSILSLLSVAVMMVILLLGVVILIVNTYRSFTVKNKPKGWYYAWILFWIIIVWIALAAGTTLISKVSSIDVQSITNPDDVVNLSMIRYETALDGDKRIWRESPIQIDWSFPVIAPVNVWASLFSANYREYVKSKFQWVQIVAVQLDCWNNQTIGLSSDEINFAWQCFYEHKGTYDISLMFLLRDGNNNQTVEEHLMKRLYVSSEITVKGIDRQVNQWNNELSVGPLPAEVEFDADAVFKDLNIAEYNLLWDWDNDTVVDKLNETKYRHTYDSSKVYYPLVRFLDIHGFDGSWDWYTFPLRVTQSWIPVCKINLTKQQGHDYIIEGYFLDWTERSVADHSYIVTDKLNNKVIEEVHDTDTWYKINFRFPGQWRYVVRMNFVTDDNQEWYCEEAITLSEKANFAVNYEFSASSATSNGYEKINADKIKETKTVAITEIPTKLKLKFQNIEPRTIDTKITVMFDGKPIVYTNTDEYIFDIRDSESHKIAIQIVDDSRWLEYEEELEAKIWLDDIVWKLSIIWDTVGFEPFTVTLDASASRLTDSSDQITYFTWDFWDWETQQKVSNWVVKHQYSFDYAENNGIFVPSVTIYTQKWRSVTIKANASIVVKKQVVKLDIYSPSHPLQEAKAGSPVELALDFSGLPTKITWDFWDGNQSECEWRTCSDVTKTWSEKWTYLIKVLVDFEDQQSVEQTLQFKIR